MAVDNPPLTERGNRQAELAAKALSDRAVDQLLVSPLVRAQETAEPIAAALGIEPTTLPWLAEISAGPWEGTPQEVVERTFRESRDRPLEQQWDGIPGGESFRDFHVRVTNGFTSLFHEQRRRTPVGPSGAVATRPARIGGLSWSPTAGRTPSRSASCSGSSPCRGSGNDSSRSTRRSAPSNRSTSPVATRSACSDSATCLTSRTDVQTR